MLLSPGGFNIGLKAGVSVGVVLLVVCVLVVVIVTALLCWRQRKRKDQYGFQPMSFQDMSNVDKDD